MYQELKFNRIQPSEFQIFKQKLKLIYKMLITERFIFIELKDNEEKQTVSVNPTIFNASIEETNAAVRELHIRTIPVVYKDVSKGMQLMKTNYKNNLQLAN